MLRHSKNNKKYYTLGDSKKSVQGASSVCLSCFQGPYTEGIFFDSTVVVEEVVVAT